MAAPDSPKTGQKTSMPRRSDAPGLKWDRRANGRQPYWVASQVVRDTMGYPDRSVRLPADAEPETLAMLCQEHTARLNAWIAAIAAEPEQLTKTRYDGSVFSLCRIYQEHPQSRFHKVKRNTRKTYTDSLKIIERTVGKRLIRNLTILDVQHWYDEWRKPSEDGKAERIDRAHDAVAMFRTVLRFGAALRHRECRQLNDELAMIKFEKGGAREEEMTYQQAVAFIRTALELGSKGIIPDQRARYMAIGVAGQFELLLRQKDIIGEWAPAQPDVENTICFGGEMWTGFFTWERIPGWRWRLKTSKSKYRAAAEFDLTNYSLLFPLLDSVPHDERTGAIIKGEHGLPVRERSYRKWFREIARAAGVPDAVWSMDTRAGGATEAEESGADLEAIQDALTHSKKEMSLRYIRRRSTRIATVAQARNRQRAAQAGGSERSQNGTSEGRQKGPTKD
jgi:hypothetical protein